MSSDSNPEIKKNIKYPNLKNNDKIKSCSKIKKSCNLYAI